jgi:FkbM family methyltransferase
MSIEVVETHTILPDIISQGSIVIDCGANVGRFSLEMIRRFGCVCYAIEAAPETFGKIPNAANLYRYNFALCGAHKLVTMAIDSDITRSTIKGEPTEKMVAVQGRQLEEFLVHEVAGRTVDLVKMDIEGAEIEVIASLGDDLIKRVGQWTIEFHDFRGMMSVSEVERCVERIAGLGFYELFWSRHRNNADVLLVNKNRFPRRRYIIEHHIVRRARAGIRLASRLFQSQTHKIAFPSSR